MPSPTNSYYCTTLQNMNGLLEHKLLHYGELGTKCKSNECGVRGFLNTEILRKVNERITNLTITESIKELKIIDNENV